MHRRSFVTAAGSLATGTLAGCLDEEPDPKPQIRYLELQNLRRNGSYRFHVRIEDNGETVFETTEELVGGDPTAGVTVIETPVSEPGDYEVTVQVDEYERTVNTERLVTEDEDCLYLDFYLGPVTLHYEYLTWPCETEEAD